MARLHTWGAETGALPAGSSGVVVSDIQARTGAYSFYVDNRDDVMPFSVNNLTEVFLRFGIYPTGSAGQEYMALAGIVQFYNSANQPQVSISRDVSTGAIYAMLGQGDGGALGNGGVLALNQWHCVEVRHLINNTTGVVQVKLDGTLVIDYTGDTQKDATTNIATIQFKSTYVTSGGWRITTGYIDDIAINDTSGTKNNSWPGLGGIVWCPVDGDGMVSEMTPSAGDDNYACVDEVPASDDDYVSGLASEGNTDFYTIDESNLPANGTINAIKLCYRAKVDEGSGVVVPLASAGGGPGVGDEQSLSTSFAQISQTFEVDPGDDSELTLAKVKAMQIGLLATEPS